MTLDEMKIQVALGSFPEREFTPQAIQDCKNLEIFKLFLKLWIRKPPQIVYMDYDGINNIFLNHPLMSQQLREYLITGRIYQKMQRDQNIPLKIRIYDPAQHISLAQKKLLKLEEEIFGND